MDMRILVLTKRQYMGMDLISDRFGRFRELPLALARSGHTVAGVALSYRLREERSVTDGELSENGIVTWHSINLTDGLMPRLARYSAWATDIAKEFRPDVLWSCSDAYHAIFGTWLAQRCGVPCIIDLYDNFESFKATSLPGVLPLFKRAVRIADGVTCISPALVSYVVQKYRREGPLLLLPNSARTDIFFSRPQSFSRSRLQLPEQATIIGTAGALDKSRGIAVLFRAFELLANDNPNLHLALAGPRGRFARIPDHPRVHDLGILPLDSVSTFLNALDVAVICNRDSVFGRYCFPQKAYEIIACRIPLVAAAVGAMNQLLENYPECLYQPEDTSSLAKTILHQLRAKIVVNLPVPAWKDAAKKLEAFLFAVVNGKSCGTSSSLSILP